MTSLAQSGLLLSTPLIHDHARAGRVAEALCVEDRSALGEVARALWSASPYLARLALRRREIVVDGRLLAPAACIHLAHQQMITAPIADRSAVAAALRQSKALGHWALALGECSGAFDARAAARAASDLADAGISRALACALEIEAQNGRIDRAAAACGAGLFVLGMGKLGARELNFSSDVDLIFLYDRDVLSAAALRGEAEAIAVRAAQTTTRLLSEITADGYVWRVDLRLRPDPGSTPVALSTAAAGLYYESFGQTWERSAFIKARVCAGDLAAGAQFLDENRSFVWRRNLDFSAILDIKAMAAQLQSHFGASGIDPAQFNLKLGQGGIREIEFLAQIPQLIHGGRRRDLRVADTQGALEALARADLLPGEDARQLTADYWTLRGMEHRLQMLEDQQTQDLPNDEEGKAAFAALCGAVDGAAFDTAILALRRRVRAAFVRQTADNQAPAFDPLQGLYTGVEPGPAALAELQLLGFTQPSEIAATLRDWARGRVRATRSERARQLLAKATPQLLRAMAATGAPDLAYARFAEFFGGLNAGVHVLAMLEANPALLTEIVEVLALAPKLARTLARRPAIIEALLDGRFHAPLADDDPMAQREALAADLAEPLARAPADVEEALDRARRFRSEAAFRIGFHVLHDRCDVDAARFAYTALAETALRAMWDLVVAERARRDGPFPGRLALLGLGKLGGRELAAGSDLDLILIFDPIDGARGAEAQAARLAQRLVSALSAQTAEGALYSIDLQLRPSGKAGPVAVRMAAFADYYATEAWTWELMALTRARPICGDSGLCDQISAAIEAALVSPLPAGVLAADAAAMRALVRGERKPTGFWDHKRQAGGLIDIEFIAQALTLMHSRALPSTARDVPGQIAALAEIGALAAEDAKTLEKVWLVTTALDQVLRVAVSENAIATDLAAGAAKALCRRAGRYGAPTEFQALQDAIVAWRADIVDLFRRYVEEQATETSRPLR